MQTIIPLSYLKNPTNYFIVSYLTGISGALFLFGHKASIGSELTMCCGAIAIPGILIMLNPYIKLIWRSAIGKILIGYIAVLSGKISWSIACHAVHSIIYTDPGNFSTTTGIISLFAIIPVWLFFICVCLIFIGGSTFVFVTIKSYSSLNENSFIFSFNRYNNKLGTILSILASREGNLYHFSFGCFIIYFCIMSAIHRINTHNAVLHGFLTKIIMVSDYYDTSECQNVLQGDYFAYLENGNISIAHLDKQTNTYIFYQSKCINKTMQG